MKICPREQDVAAWLAGQLDPAERAEFERHLGACAHCSALARELRPVAGALRDTPRAPSPDLAAAVLARIEAQPSPAAWRAPLALAACLALALLGLWLFAPRGGPVPVASPRPAEEPEAARELLAAAPAADTPPEPVAAVSAAALPETRATALARGWLVAAQEPDGAWLPERWGAQGNYAVGVTALAMLALLSEDGAAPPSASAPVLRAASSLLAQQDARGLFGPDITGSLYNHALASLALFDLEARHPGSVPPDRLRRAQRVLTDAQRDAGGWSYLRAPRSRPNTSLTAWALLALIRAEDAGLGDAAAAIPRALAWLEATVDDDGRAGYRGPGDHPRGPETLTAAAALCFLDRPSAYRDRLVRMMEHVQRDVTRPEHALDFYRTFFQAAALREAGLGDSAEMAELADRLRGAQERDGAQAGSWPGLDLWSQAGGRVYSTAMAVLALREL